MDEHIHRVLILDCDPECLIGLQHALQDAGIDTTITWDKTEAFQSLESERFDLLVLGDHPPEVDSAGIFDDLSFRGTCPPVLILRKVVCEKDIEYFRWRGAVGVAPREDPPTVLDQVAKALASAQFRAKAAIAGLAEKRAWRAAS